MKSTEKQEMVSYQFNIKNIKNYSLKCEKEEYK